uniref:putative deoxyribonuclease TATDN2 n=1 Tax=Ciona intestinalis TaxID=7719 RepID=UPI000EF5287A|nr:putative deoxyribonuclease TATDN2 [Ciona intestinalis]|eukprot:XP_026692882.1 putative deoxyribonuclease TATDN2 [Ciona intestinalis]
MDMLQGAKNGDTRRFDDCNRSLDENKLSRHQNTRSRVQGSYLSRSRPDGTHSAVKPRYSVHDSKRRSFSSSYEISNELKFNLRNKFDEDGLNSVRNVLCEEMTSRFPFIDTHCHIDFLFKRLNYRNKFSDYRKDTFMKNLTKNIDHFSSDSKRRSFSSSYEISNELKFNLRNKFDEDGLNSVRNVLCEEMTSRFPFIDTHCHIDFLFKRLNYRNKFSDYRKDTFMKFPSNYEGCIADWCQPSLYPTAADILGNSSFKDAWGKTSPKIWGAFGCHPHFVADYDDFVEKQIEHHFKEYDNVIAFGEMGLDYSDRFGPTDHELQKKVFIRQLKFCEKFQVPLVIHCRDADKDLFEIMRKHVHHTTAIHRHCLTTEISDVQPLLDHFPNLYVGFTNLITNRSAYKARGSAGVIPLERIVLETDAPYFIPGCVSQATKGAVKFSHPGMASSVACELARIKGVDIDDVLTQVRANVKHLYNI